MEDFEEKLNELNFPGCEGVLVGDVLHYSLIGEKNFKTGIKDLICIFTKVALKSDYKIEIFGKCESITLFSSSYRGRLDHYKAFKDVTSIINHKISFECIKSRFSLRGLKYVTIVPEWCRLMKNAGFSFGERMCLCRDLLEAYKDYSFVDEELKKRNIFIKNLLVYCDVMPVDCFFSQIFKKKSCNVLTFHHGAFQVADNAWAYQKSKSDFFLADSEASCDDARDVGYSSNIMAVGSPFQFNNPAIEVKGPYKSEIFGIVMNSGADPIEDNYEMLRVVQEYCRIKGKKMYIKYHPADKAERYKHLIDAKVVKGQYFKEIIMDEFIDMIDIAVVSTSTAIKTALSKNTPTLIFVRKGFDHKKFRGTDELKFIDLEGLEKQVNTIEKGYEDVMRRQNAYLNVLGTVKENYSRAYAIIGIL